jgi:ankyrin repeat protein
MLVSGENPSVRYIWSDSTLGEAVAQAAGNGKEPELASLLVAAGADVNAMTFYEAEEAELLFPGIFDIKGEPLSVLAAVRRNDVSALCRMLENGANPDKPLSEDFSTPLIVALQLGHTRCAELLVQAGACLYARDQQGVSPLQFVDKNYCKTRKDNAL